MIKLSVALVFLIFAVGEQVFADNEQCANSQYKMNPVSYSDHHQSDCKVLNGVFSGEMKSAYGGKDFPVELHIQSEMVTGQIHYKICDNSFVCRSYLDQPDRWATFPDATNPTFTVNTYVCHQNNVDLLLYDPQGRLGYRFRIVVQNDEQLVYSMCSESKAMLKRN